jgi:hypothetical protein
MSHRFAGVAPQDSFIIVYMSDLRT